MLVLALLLAQAVPADDAEIVVIGEKLARLSVWVGKDPQGHFSCRLSETGGNERLDRSLCKTAAACARKGPSGAPSIKACIDRRKPSLFADFRRIYGARQQ